MIDSLKSLIASLREELQQYGEMLARLDEQQEHVMGRKAEDVLRSVDSIQDQGRILQQVRHQRERCQAGVAGDLCLPDSATLAELIPQLPADYRPLVDALVQENNQLLFRVQQRARQNHLLLSRSLEMMQQFLGVFMPRGHGPVYGGRGSVFQEPAPARHLYEAVG
jgi:flagellar biosynthesis/type III secretory pathway chaperone